MFFAIVSAVLSGAIVYFISKKSIQRHKATIENLKQQLNNIRNKFLEEQDITRQQKEELLIQNEYLQLEKQKSDKLLHNILPEETAEELKMKEVATPRSYRNVSVLFADIQGFTKISEGVSPYDLVNDLQSYFSKFDDVVKKNFVEKIKTVGDSFFCAGGIPIRNKSHAFNAVLAALELQKVVKQLGEEREKTGRKAWKIRIGIHTGPVVSGVVGKQKMTYDIWGDTVNVAKRMEGACFPGRVNVSLKTYEIIKDYFECDYRGKVYAKNKGDVDMYFVNRINPDFSKDADGSLPNKKFQTFLAEL